MVKKITVELDDEDYEVFDKASHLLEGLDENEVICHALRFYVETMYDLIDREGIRISENIVMLPGDEDVDLI